MLDGVPRRPRADGLPRHRAHRRRQRLDDDRPDRRAAAGRSRSGSSATPRTGPSPRPTARARGAHGELILFLNNDIEPIGDHWLGHMVETLRRPGAVAVGAGSSTRGEPGRPRAGAAVRRPDAPARGSSSTGRPASRCRAPIGGGEDPLAEPAAAVRRGPGADGGLPAGRAGAPSRRSAGSTRATTTASRTSTSASSCATPAGARLRRPRRPLAPRVGDPADRGRDVRADSRAPNREALSRRWGPRICRASAARPLQGRGGSWPRRRSMSAITVTSHDPTRRLRRLVHRPRARRRA